MSEGRYSMKRNVHIYFSEMRYESRIFKIADTLSRHEIFDEIYILGRVGHDLPLHEKMNARTTIFGSMLLFCRY